MFKRVMVAVVGIPLLLVIFFLLPPIATAILFALIAMIAVYEVLWSTKFIRHTRISVYAVLFAGLIPLWVYFGQDIFWAQCAVFVYLLLVFIEAIASKHKVKTEHIAGAFFFPLMIAYCLSAFVRVAAMEGGRYLILLPLAAAFISDAFALFAGMLFGKHKLAPRLSPKKTVEGAIGGVVGAVAAMAVYGAIVQFAFHLGANYLLLALYGVLGSAVSQLGDLSFSYIKRQYGLKDFGKIFPGHGGILDRFDSVIFCAPLFEILLRLLPAIAVA